MEQNFKSLVKDFIVNVWGDKETKSNNSCPNQLQSQSSPAGLGSAVRVERQRDGKFQEGKLYCVCYTCRVSVGACNVCVGACTCRC